MKQQKLINLPIRLACRFGGHETFTMRSGWLIKAYNLVKEEGSTIKVFKMPETLVKLGVGKNMVKSIEFWSTVTRIIRKTTEGYQITLFGKNLIEDHDPFLENVSSAWMLHYLLCTGDRTGMWTAVFSVMHNQVINIDDVRKELAHPNSVICTNKPISLVTLNKDYLCLVNSYADNEREKKINNYSKDCAFKDLNLLSRDDSNNITLMRARRNNLSIWVLLASIKIYRDRHLSKSQTIDIEMLIYGYESPGMVFRLTKPDLLEMLSLATKYDDLKISISRTSGAQYLSWKDIDQHTPRELWLRAYEH